MSHEHDGEVEAATHHDLGLSGLNRLQRRLLFSLCILHTVRWQQNAGAGEAKIWKPFDAPMGLMYPTMQTRRRCSLPARIVLRGKSSRYLAARAGMKSLHFGEHRIDENKHACHTATQDIAVVWNRPRCTDRMI